MLSFVGVQSYKTRDSYTAVSGERFYEAEVKICVDILADRSMTAAELKSFADNAILPMISNLGLDVISLERKNCEFSKAHSRYAAAVELEYRDKIPMPTRTASAVIINGTLEPMLTAYRIIKDTKTSQTPLVNKTMLSNLVSPMPTKLVLSGKLPFAEADAAISHYSAISGLQIPVNIGANTFSNMVLTSLDLKQISTNGCEITLELTEVNE